jgi:hypothetical protein
MDVILDPLRDMLETMARWLPSLLGALLILLLGYVVSKAIEGIAQKLLRKVGFDKLIHRGTAGSYIEKVIASPSRLIGSVAFWLLWLGTLSIAITVLGVPALTNFVYAIYAYVPNIVASVVIFLVAGAISSGAVALVLRLMGDTPTGKLVATAVPAITMLIAVFMILSQLQIARDIVNITYTALIGSVALGMALAFGLGGREVAARLLEQAYENGAQGVKQARQDALVARARGEEMKDQAVDAVKEPDREA